MNDYKIPEIDYPDVAGKIFEQLDLERYGVQIDVEIGDDILSASVDIDADNIMYGQDYGTDCRIYIGTRHPVNVSAATYTVYDREKDYSYTFDLKRWELQVLTKYITELIIND